MSRQNFPAKYLELIDEPTWAFIERTESFYPPETATFGIAEQRAIYNRMAAAFHNGRPAGLSVQDTQIAGVPVREYGAQDGAPLVLYFHGGGFVVGGLDSHDDVCAELSDLGGLPLMSVDYRLEPEHHHPAALEDCLAVARACAARPLILVGDSAGGNLAAACSHILRDEKTTLLGQILIYPGLTGAIDQGSVTEHANAPMLTRDDILFYAGLRGEPDPTSAPLVDSNFAGLPETVIFAAECDPLCDDGPDYVARIKSAGGTGACHVEKGLVHGYLRARHTAPRATNSFTRIVEELRRLAGLA